MKIKPAEAGTALKKLLQRTLKRAADRRLGPVWHPFQAWIQTATRLPGSVAAGSTGSAALTLRPTPGDATLEQLSSRVLQAVRAAPVSPDPHRLLVAFHSGRLQGVTCAVVVAGRRVRLRLRAVGARQRADLLRGQKILAGRLGSAGFELDGYEVSP